MQKAKLTSVEEAAHKARLLQHAYVETLRLAEGIYSQAISNDIGMGLYAAARAEIFFKESWDAAGRFVYFAKERAADYGEDSLPPEP